MSQDGEEDYGKRLLKGLVDELIRRLEDPAEAKALSAAEGELIRKLCSDSSVTLSSIKRGDFGKVAQRAAENYPFPEGGVVDMGGTA
jgi:hypothetical protein